MDGKLNVVLSNAFMLCSLHDFFLLCKQENGFSLSFSKSYFRPSWASLWNIVFTSQPLQLQNIHAFCWENILLLKVSTLTFILDTLIKKKKILPFQRQYQSLHRLTDRNIILDLSSSPVMELQSQDFMKHRVEHFRWVRMEGLGSTGLSERRALWRRKWWAVRIM